MVTRSRRHTLKRLRPNEQTAHCLTEAVGVPALLALYALQLSIPWAVTTEARVGEGRQEEHHKQPMHRTEQRPAQKPDSGDNGNAMQLAYLVIIITIVRLLLLVLSILLAFTAATFLLLLLVLGDLKVIIVVILHTSEQQLGEMRITLIIRRSRTRAKSK